jgi:hypothetical protein
VAALALQYGGQDKPQDKPEAGKPAEAGAKKSGAAAPMSIPLTGVTAANAAQVESALESLKSPVYRCAACNTAQRNKGTCSTCKKELVEDKNATVVREVSIEPTKGTLQFALAPGQELRMSELDRALKAQSVSINSSQLAVPSYTRLYFSAPAESKDAQAAIQKALEDSKLFTKVVVKQDEKKNLVAMVEGGQANYGQVASAIEKGAKDVKLTDVAWTAPCGHCAKNGNMQANCKGCWPETSST